MSNLSKTCVPKDLNFMCDDLKCGATKSWKLGYEQAQKDAQEREAKLVEALKFYANQENYEDDFNNDMSDVPYVTIDGETDCYLCGGKRAREVLKDLGLYE